MLGQLPPCHLPSGPRGGFCSGCLCDLSPIPRVDRDSCGIGSSSAAEPPRFPVTPTAGTSPQPGLWQKENGSFLAFCNEAASCLTILLETPLEGAYFERKASPEGPSPSLCSPSSR